MSPSFCAKMGPIKVAICSRDCEQNYEWLIDFLVTRMCKRTKIEARPVYITNNTSTFRQEVSAYDFAILYHTKKRGRINITNVTSSLYDEELRFLSDRFGKTNVVVVIDDLEKSDGDEKRRIIAEQRDLKEYAWKVFLFTERDKNHTKNPLNKMEDGKVKKNLNNLKNNIKKSKRTRKPRISNAVSTRRTTFVSPCPQSYSHFFPTRTTNKPGFFTMLSTFFLRPSLFFRTPRPLQDA